MTRRLVAALALVMLVASSAGTYAARAARSCTRCGHGGCCATGPGAACSVKSSCCDPVPEERVALDHGGKPGIVPDGEPLPAPALAPEDRSARQETPRDVPRVPLVPPPRPSRTLV